ncbi:Hypothetical protein NTJ_02630 [Nesidiocoris tenuis]|uniref:Uncharacterized protein n=1 Tax=Nesidiocoris tenuis TaxID=355587 RepID=A0ABN7AF23_9HEMI|nr:Hypothetical protein NTJ_02630 [Nesidiocoris tenuis]
MGRITLDGDEEWAMQQGRFIGQKEQGWEKQCEIISNVFHPDINPPALDPSVLLFFPSRTGGRVRQTKHPASCIALQISIDYAQTRSSH